LSGKVLSKSRDPVFQHEAGRKPAGTACCISRQAIAAFPVEVVMVQQRLFDAEAVHLVE
jgi:hypothetical protein